MSTKYVLALVFALAFSRSSSAGTLAGSVSASWTGYTCVLDPSEPIAPCVPPYTPIGDSISDTGPNVSVGLVFTDPAGSLSVNAMASAGYGSANAFARSTSGVFGSLPNVPLRLGPVTAQASASFDDMIAISGGSGTGTLAFDLGVSCLRFDANVSANLTVGPAIQFCTGGFIQAVLSTTFSFDVPFHVRGSVSTTAMDVEPLNPFSGSSDGTVVAQLRNLIVSDGNGQRLTDFTYSSDSGSRYAFQDGTFIPEPETASTVLLSLFFGLAIWKLRAYCQQFPRC
jgi:hypothetical protein